MRRVVDGGVRFACSSCGGHLIGLAPFEREHPGDGRRIWVAAQAGQPGGTCPFCSRELLAPAMPDPPPGLAVCRLCEQVWVPAEAEPWLQSRSPTAAATPGGAGGAGGQSPLGHPDECPGCGAPWAPDPGGCCRYCKEQLVSAPAVTIIIGGPAQSRTSGLLDSLIGGIGRDW
jgi:hypothetical protein